MCLAQYQDGIDSQSKVASVTSRVEALLVSHVSLVGRSVLCTSASLGLLIPAGQGWHCLGHSMIPQSKPGPQRAGDSVGGSGTIPTSGIFSVEFDPAV